MSSDSVYRVVLESWSSNCLEQPPECPGGERRFRRSGGQWEAYCAYTHSNGEVSTGGAFPMCQPNFTPPAGFECRPSKDAKDGRR